MADVIISADPRDAGSSHSETDNKPVLTVHNEGNQNSFCPEHATQPSRNSSMNSEEQITLLLREGGPSSSSGQSYLPPESAEKANNIPAVVLPKSSYIVLVVSLYAALALAAWILTCLLTFGPLTMRDYGWDVSIKGLHEKLIQNLDIYRLARTVQAVVTVVTIPLTSAVCSAAAVIFTQSNKGHRHMSMRQMMTLADKSWTDPATIIKLLFGRGKKVNSSFLICALLLNMFGASITTLQSVFLSQKTIKVPSEAEHVGTIRVFDHADTILSPSYGGTSMITTSTRNVLKSTTNLTPQPRLWQDSPGCSSLNESLTEQCAIGVSSFSQLHYLTNPYLAPLPVGFHTGLLKQFLPRINSTVSFEAITQKEMPLECGKIPNAFYAYYADAHYPTENSTYDIARNWSIEACMPGDQSVSPWKDTKLRQSFTEELYLNLSVRGYETFGLYNEAPDALRYGGIFKVTSRTTAGYFELPNYMNKGKAGMLIDGSPDESRYCAANCFPQYTSPLKLTNQGSNASWNSGRLDNKGPLLNVAIALFGHSSFIAARLQHPGAFIVADDSSQRKTGGISGHWDDTERACVDQKPLSPLLNGKFPTGGTMDSRIVSFDPGVGAVIPAISRAAMILISSLWAVFITLLFSVAIYSARTPRWTNQLDAFAKMRVGAAMNERISLDVGYETNTIEALDEMFGYVGDATGGEGDVGILGMGAGTPLNGVREYRCYRGDEAKKIRRAQIKTEVKVKSALVEERKEKMMRRQQRAGELRAARKKARNTE